MVNIHLTIAAKLRPRLAAIGGHPFFGPKQAQQTTSKTRHRQLIKCWFFFEVLEDLLGSKFRTSDFAYRLVLPPIWYPQNQSQLAAYRATFAAYRYEALEPSLGYQVPAGNIVP